MGLLKLSEANKLVSSRKALGSLTSTPLERTKEHNPLTKTGKKVMSSMKEQYGKRAKEVFYKSINKKVPGSSKWHK